MSFLQEEAELLKGLDSADSIIMNRNDVKSYFKVSVANISDDINLKKKWLWLKVELIKSLEPLEVRLHQQSAKI